MLWTSLGVWPLGGSTVKQRHRNQTPLVISFILLRDQLHCAFQSYFGLACSILWNKTRTKSQRLRTRYTITSTCSIVVLDVMDVWNSCTMKTSPKLKRYHQNVEFQFISVVKILEVSWILSWTHTEVRVFKLCMLTKETWSAQVCLCSKPWHRSSVVNEMHHNTVFTLIKIKTPSKKTRLVEPSWSSSTCENSP